MALKTVIVCDHCGERTWNFNACDQSAFCDKEECQKAKCRHDEWPRQWRVVKKITLCHEPGED